MARGRARGRLLAAAAVQVLAGAFAVLSIPTPVAEAPVRPAVDIAHGAATTTTAVPETTTTTALAAPAPETAPAPAPAPTGPRTLMLIGDSMAFTAAEGLAPHAGAYGFQVRNEGIMGCGVVRGGPFRYFGAQRDMEARCEAWPDAWTAALHRNQPHMVGIVVGRWELMDRVHDGRWTNVFDPAFVAYLETEIDRAYVIAASTGARVVVFSTPYYRRGLTPDGGLFPEDDPARVDAINVVLRRVAERRGVPVVDVGGWLSPEGRYTRDVAGIRVRSDGVHLTRQTGQLLAPWLFPQLQAL